MPQRLLSYGHARRRGRGAAVVALPDTIAFDLCTAVEVFGRVALPTGRPASRVLVCATEPVVTAGPLRIAPTTASKPSPAAHTIVIPGRNGCHGGNTGGGMNPWLQIYADVMKK
jgi:hypothetical protein